MTIPATGSPPRYEPFGWHHWPEHFFMSYQFRRALGETQEGGGSVSECFQAASRMIPGDLDSWHREWMVVAESPDYFSELIKSDFAKYGKLVRDIGFKPQ